MINVKITLKDGTIIEERVETWVDVSNLLEQYDYINVVMEPEGKRKVYGKRYTR